MRIISKFHDYYDGALSQGSDQETIFLRETATIHLDRKLRDTLPRVQKETSSYYFRNNNLEISFFYIGFCGVIIPSVKIVSTEGTGYTKILYSFDEVKSFAEEENLPIDFKKKNKYRFYFRYDPSCGKDYELFFQNKETTKLEKLFFDYNTPVFVFQEDKRELEVITNPNLKELQFFKVKDPYSCFQDIYMYIAGVLLLPTKPLIEVSNESKIHKHGFDKWSFRKKTDSSSD